MINSVCCSRDIYLFTCLYIYLLFTCLFVCVKNGTCERIAIPGYCLNSFRSIFGFQFCLLDKKLILGSKNDLTKYEKVFILV